jgi:hypothetical protein
LTTVISVLNPLDTIGVVCSSPLDICDPDSVDVDAEFGCVLVVIPVIPSLVELGVVFSMTVVISVPNALDTSGVVFSSPFVICDVDSVDIELEVSCVFVTISVVV